MGKLPVLGFPRAASGPPQVSEKRILYSADYPREANLSERDAFLL